MVTDSGPRDAASPRILPMGERAMLLEVGSLEAAVGLHRRLAASRPAGVVDLVPAARTVLVRVDQSRLSLAAARAWIEATTSDAAPVAPASPEVVELEVLYDGADLAETAAMLGMTADELVRRHTSAAWTVAFTGFAPGFGYLVSPDWPFDVARLPSPRTRVPRGAVGLAGEFTGAYPRETPGGWRLIGRTDAPLFDPDAASPALLAPGTPVRFRAVDRSATALADRQNAGAPQDSGERAASRGAHAVAREPEGRQAAIRVIEPGLLATVQDLGRAGSASLGVAVSGALDRGSARTANRLLGNAEGAAVIEVTMGGFRAVALSDLWFAVTGAWGAIRLAGLQSGQREVDPYEAHAWPAGAELQLDWFGHGARGYLAVRGGVEGPKVLGSRSTDLLAAIGPPRLRVGDELALGHEVDAPIPVAAVAPWGAPHDEELEVDLAPGPRADWFAASALEALFEEVWTVTNDADRVGMRLDGPELVRTRTDELPSEGMVPGALQVPPSGRPTVLLADGPVTGGYPVIAVATDAALDLLAQARPGTHVRFRHARRSP
ncbi:sensor histidine kinase inhibitor, KipI family [Microbacterium sp. cf046]|uniref:5-oxoprolinase subunit B/C family protein n=1 Tax=Microbacterium sp. cf046 TaxID=1761803 RepID=UPI0008E86BBD|nr:5-oxoprolinase/urea amidolyase family protein [Microbacterium sp. cf046]SFR94181.1 sensor histidine kinase inhibitor, KipI family [Microbacterium sp. cf046]